MIMQKLNDLFIIILCFSKLQFSYAHEPKYDDILKQYYIFIGKTNETMHSILTYYESKPHTKKYFW